MPELQVKKKITYLFPTRQLRKDGKYPVFPLSWFSILLGSTILSSTIPQAHQLQMNLNVYFAIYNHETQLAFHF